MNQTVFQVLLVLKDEEKEAETILADIRRLEPGSKPPAIASFYRALKKASDAGFLGVAEAVGGRGGVNEVRGRPRQRYRITRSGRTALQVEARRLERLATAALGARK